MGQRAQDVPKQGKKSPSVRIAAIESHVAGLLAELGVPVGPHTRDTPARVARMFASEICAGLHEPMPRLTDFPIDGDDAPAPDQINIAGPIAVRSCCAHHLVPILGSAWIGFLPGERMVGLSKFHRLTAWVMARPQVQEQATEQLASLIMEHIAPAGLGVIVRAKHFCTAWRGVRDEPSLMTTSVMRGAFRTSDAARAEFFSLIAGMGFRT